MDEHKIAAPTPKQPLDVGWYSHLGKPLGVLDSQSINRQESPFFKLSPDLLLLIFSLLPHNDHWNGTYDSSKNCLLRTCKPFYKQFCSNFSWLDVHNMVQRLSNEKYLDITSASRRTATIPCFTAFFEFLPDQTFSLTQYAVPAKTYCQGTTPVHFKGHWVLTLSVPGKRKFSKDLRDPSSESSSDSDSFSDEAEIKARRPKKRTVTCHLVVNETKYDFEPVSGEQGSDKEEALPIHLMLTEISVKQLESLKVETQEDWQDIQNQPPLPRRRKAITKRKMD